MATAEQFRGAAYWLRCAADEADRAKRCCGVAEADHGVRGGALESAVSSRLSDIVTKAGVMGERCEEVAAECARRAAICDQYAGEVAQASAARSSWIANEHTLAADQGRSPDLADAPVVPAPPHDWVEL